MEASELCKYDLLVAVNDATAGEVVWRQLNNYAILREDTNVVLTHLATDVSKYFVSVIEFDSEHCIRQRLDNTTLNLDCAFLSHILHIPDTVRHLAYMRATISVASFATFTDSPQEREATVGAGAIWQYTKRKHYRVDLDISSVS